MEVAGADRDAPQPAISPGYGFTAIIVAFLGRLNPFGILIAGFVLALTFLGGEAAQIALGLPEQMTRVFQGLLLFYVLACDTFILYRRAASCGRHRRRRRPCAWLEGILLTIITAATPLLLAALGELVAERSGVLNLGVEGMMAIGAVVRLRRGVRDRLSGARRARRRSLAGAVDRRALRASSRCVFVANQVASGLALTLFGLGLSGLLGEAFVGTPGPQARRGSTFPASPTCRSSAASSSARTRSPTSRSRWRSRSGGSCSARAAG